MKKILTARMLRDMDACPEQVELFERLYPDGITRVTTPMVRRALREGLDVEWLVFQHAPLVAEYNRQLTLLLAEYRHQNAPFLAEYERQRESLWAEYEHLCAPLWAEYLRQRNSLQEEYERQRATLWAEYLRQHASLLAEFVRQALKEMSL